MKTDFDIVVIGGGHAGVEAARAAALLGCRTALLTLDPAAVARMSCNPAIGGVGKGQMVREIDALGGLMGRAADATGIQFRMLNRSKGPAVWGPRCQSDRHAYAHWIRRELERTPNLHILPGEARALVRENGRVVAVETAEPHPTSLRCRAVVVTAGTFLSGLLHLGRRTWPGGRIGEPPAADLSASLRDCGLELGRLKTGTCPRLAAGSIDYEQCIRQDGDQPPTPFSFLHDRLDVDQLPCWLTHTTEAVHEIIRANLHRAPMYSGQIRSTGPRYCPSIETKIVRFADKPQHLVFLEPEGRTTDWVYANGIPTSLPRDVQSEIVRGIPGLTEAEVFQWGYAIEYDFAPPTQLTPTLETKTVGGLFLAGQVNGTTGYEEAAGQGLLAGVNAARTLRGQEGVVLGRDQAYLGVMVDDLVTKGVLEPYRMFTSRAEHRLRLRADNADARLTPLGRQIGLVDDARWERFSAARRTAERTRELLQATRHGGKSLWELLKRPDATLDGALDLVDDEAIRAELYRLVRAEPAAHASLASDARYAGYLAKQDAALGRMADLDRRAIPEGLAYDAIAPLRKEARERLGRIRPRSLGQALRISGITPADITVLAVHLAGRRRASGGEKTPR